MNYHFNKISISNICALLAILIITYELLFSFKVILVDSPLEFRENVMVCTTDLLVRGENPYAFDKQPAHTNVYGIMSHILIYPFAKMLGASFLIHRLVSTVFTLLSCALIVLVLVWEKTHKSLIVCGAAFFLYHMVRANSISAFPAAQGQFLFLCSIVVPWRYRFSNGSLILSAIFSILALTTKPYFVLGFPVIAMYLFIAVSKKRAVLFGILSLVLLGFTILVMNYVFPCYFLCTFYSHLCNAPHSISHLFNQIEDYFDESFALLIIPALIAITGLICTTRRLLRTPPKKYLVQIRNLFDLKHPNRPLINLPIGLMPFALVFSAAILLKMGQHHGRAFGYFAELLTPFLIMTACPTVENELKPRRSLLFAGLILLNLSLMLFALPDLPDAKRRDWSEWQDIIAQNERVYACDPLAIILQKEGKKAYVTGQSEYFSSGIISLTPEKLRSRAKRVYQKYCDDLEAKVESQYFDLMITRSDQKPFWDKTNAIEKYYAPKEQKILPMPKKWKLQLWKPKSKIKDLRLNL